MSAEIGVGVIAPYDFALDRELWRWVPTSVNLLLTRTTHHDLPVSAGIPRAVITSGALVRRCAHADAEAVFISCTNVPTYGLLAPLEAELAMPVLSANQVTLWAALAAVGLSLVGEGQWLARVAGPARVCRRAGTPA